MFTVIQVMTVVELRYVAYSLVVTCLEVFFALFLFKSCVDFPAISVRWGCLVHKKVKGGEVVVMSMLLVWLESVVLKLF